MRSYFDHENCPRIHDLDLLGVKFKRLFAILFQADPEDETYSAVHLISTNPFIGQKIPKYPEGKGPQSVRVKMRNKLIPIFDRYSATKTSVSGVSIDTTEFHLMVIGLENYLLSLVPSEIEGKDHPYSMVYYGEYRRQLMADLINWRLTVDLNREQEALEFKLGSGIQILPKFKLKAKANLNMIVAAKPSFTADEIRITVNKISHKKDSFVLPRKATSKVSQLSK
jgi:hypothetical protein